MGHVSNNSRGWPSGGGRGSSRRQYRGRGGPRTTTSATGFNYIENRLSDHNTGGRRGRGSWRAGAETRTRQDDKDQTQTSIAKYINDADMMTIEDAPRMPTSNEDSNQLCQVEVVKIDAAGAGGQDLETRASPSSGPDRGINQPTNKPVGKSARNTGGKHKQRREARQLIDGLDGLDIDLLESLTPSSAEVGPRSRNQTGTRKINLSHLVNYNYDRNTRSGGRTRHDSASSGYNDRSSRHHSSHHHHQNYRYHDSGEHKFSKQQFLQANCQFVVIDGYDYTIHKVNPDWPVDWDRVEEVKFRQTGATETNCPICLEPPVAAKITRCGHIYCWACVLRYLSMSDEKNVPCPICFEPIYMSDLRSVVSQSYSNHAVGEMITLKLMFRHKGCVEVVPYAANVNSMIQTSTAEVASGGLGSNDLQYCSEANLVIVDPETVINEVARREQNELRFKMELEMAEISGEGTAESGYSGMVCFIEQALEEVEKRVEKLTRMATDEVRKLQIRNQSLQIQQPSSTMDSGRSYLFYQSADGQHVYLNPFSTRILCQNYGSLENCPPVIQAEVLQMDWVSMSDAWRKRFKYLQHLPLTCEFRLIEIDFQKSHLVSPETYKQYQMQIESRAKERNRRLREEAKRDKLIQVEQNRKIYGIQPSLELSLNNPEQFPSVSNELYLGLDQTRFRDGEDEEGTTTEQDSNIETVDQVTLSFADIQLQEAAKAEKLSKQQKIHKRTNPSPWSGPANKSRDAGNPNQAQSSFAQLLVDAKTSQQKWTKPTRSSSTAAWSSKGSSAPNQSDMRGSAQGHASTKPYTNDSDDDEEELRAPPCEFTISDYLNLNVSSGKKRGKKKHS